jgi:hypothetical protein
MKSRLTILLVGLSFVAAGIGECASLFGPEAPELPNVLGTPLSVDLKNTPAPKGRIGDLVAPSSVNVVGAYGWRGPAGRVIVPTDLTLAAPIGVDLSKTPVAKGKIGDPVAPSSANVVGVYGWRGPAGGTVAPLDQALSYPMK